MALVSVHTGSRQMGYITVMKLMVPCTKQNIKHLRSTHCTDLCVRQMTDIKASRCTCFPAPRRWALHAAVCVQYLEGRTVLLATVGLGSLAITGWVTPKHEAGIGSL